MSERSDELEALLRALPGDPGCDAGRYNMATYVELELAGEDPALMYRSTAIHLSSCPACAADYAGLLEAAQRLGDIAPE